ncbi:Kiwa anti-phage protein KwaB-like domain-containing protein [Marinitoga sp. 38H-ov]|uniref:Kiwa anti-phage protein KwaB-like domain-containing protein n=1 Tax=Marinitoga sp. 38H-ov TaxID=1755814 RepID=UPI0013EB3953|nr:Kiwa anti-phage protein KwaB-like domain-containing protein [Marinitoga sp. 38H-ov]KAF2956260.1 hypothetical protein AS160_00240 [Marinitoga sp. 38H-ov]
MKNVFEEIKSKLDSASIKIYLFEKKETKKVPFVVYKLLFGTDIREKISKILMDEIDNYINQIEELNNKIPDYNPDEEQPIFKINTSEIKDFQEIYPYITEEKEPEIISKDTLNEINKIKAWIIKIEFESDKITKQFLFFQKFIKSQFMHTKKMFFILDNDEFKLVKDNILGMGNTFDIILMDNFFISKNLSKFEYIFNFVEYYQNESKDFINSFEQITFLKIDNEAKNKILSKIETSKRFAHKLYTAQRNKYYKKIDMEKLKILKKDIPIGVEIKNNKIIIDKNTDLDDLVKVLNDDYEQSLITENKYISHKKEKL